MDPPHLSRDAVLEQFDTLWRSGELLWTRTTEIHDLVAEGFQFEFRVTPAQQTKPSFPEDGKKDPKQESNERRELAVKECSGSAVSNSSERSTAVLSDIDNFLPQWHIAYVNKTHRLIFNKYCIYRPQYILLTVDPSIRQTSPLDTSDFCAAFTVLEALKTPHYVIFNCAKQAGGSRMHKHLQVFEQDRDHLLPDRILDDPPTARTVPYKYCLSKLEIPNTRMSNSAAGIIQLYGQHLRQCATALGLEDDVRNYPDTTIPHNVVLTDRWIMTIPRRAAGIGPATANAAGILGLIWVPKSSVVDAWKQLGPIHVLASLGVPDTAEKQ